MNELRIATFQRRPLFDDVAGTVERLKTDLGWCDDNEVSLAIFPECYLQGYASDLHAIARRGLTLGGELVAGILDTLASYRTTFILGVVEQRDAKFYNTAVVIKDGDLIGTYSKSHPNERGFEAGTDFSVFECAGWPFGINICNDANYPDAAQRLSRKGARLLCFPLNNMLAPETASKWRSKSIENLQQRAVETGCWTVSSDVVGEYDGKISYGCTCIVRPDGRVVKCAAEGIEDVVMFDLV